jgi:hypothetical protein
MRTQQGERVAMIAANDCFNLSLFHREYYVSTASKGAEISRRGAGSRCAMAQGRGCRAQLLQNPSS